MNTHTQLHEEITEKYSKLLGLLPLKLPPIHEVSHKIPLIDESKQLKHRLSKCPEVFHSELTQKIEQYITTGWWVPAAMKQAMPMLCIPKKNSTLQTVFNLQQQNENTWKDVTPFTDQDAICHDITQAKFRSKLDMTEAYEQTCIRPEDVCKTTFSTIFGTEPSNANGRLQCTFHIPAVDDCHIPRISWKICTCIS